MKFERADWTSFRTVEGLQQKAGVAQGRLRRLVLKELTDNALDTGTRVNVGKIEGGYFIEDQGPGLDPDQVASLFSVNRTLVSTKLLRLPTRGALGNGLRVVAGAVLASDGFLIVETRGARLRLKPGRDGYTQVVERSANERRIGTRIEIGFGPDLPADANALSWAHLAIHLAQGNAYAGKSSPWWYDLPQFHELLSASGGVPVRALIESLDGCAGGRAGEIVAMAGLSRMACPDLDSAQAARLLATAREAAKPVSPKRLGASSAPPPSLTGPMRSPMAQRRSVPAYAPTSPSRSRSGHRRPNRTPSPPASIAPRSPAKWRCSATRARSTCSGAGFVTPSPKRPKS